MIDLKSLELICKFKKNDIFVVKEDFSFNQKVYCETSDTGHTTHVIAYNKACLLKNQIVLLVEDVLQDFYSPVAAMVENKIISFDCTYFDYLEKINESI